LGQGKKAKICIPQQKGLGNLYPLPTGERIKVRGKEASEGILTLTPTLSRQRERGLLKFYLSFSR
jgi:hypothetical protein